MICDTVCHTTLYVLYYMCICKILTVILQSCEHASHRYRPTLFGTVSEPMWNIGTIYMVTKNLRLQNVSLMTVYLPDYIVI